MTRRWLILGIPLLLLACFKVEHASFTCAKTGSVKSYDVYFHIIETPTRYKASWIENDLKAHAIKIDHAWVMTVGTTSTILGTTHAHDRRPITYDATTLVPQERINSMSKDNVYDYAVKIYTGTPDQQRSIIEKLINES